MLTTADLIFLSDALPFFSALTDEERETLASHTVLRRYAEKTMLQHGNSECSGLLVVKSGQLRAFIVSDGGKEVTVFRLCAGESCIVTASCALKDVQFNISVETEKASFVYVIPTHVFNGLNESNSAVSKYAYEKMAASLSEAMWIVEQSLFSSFDKRLAAFLLEQASIDRTNVLCITHEAIANHLGSAREVVSRMLKYFSQEGAVLLSRGAVTIADETLLKAYAR